MATLTEPTLKRILTEVRIFLNQRDPNNSFWADDELTSYVNDAIKQYFLIINENAEGQYDVSTTLDIVANQETVALPADCFEVRALYKVKTNYNEILRYVNNVTQSYETGVGTESTDYSPYYYFRGDSLVLRPIPGFSETGGLLLEYTAFPETLINGQDTMNSGISPLFKELVVNYCIYKAKLKESSVIGGDTYAPIQQHLADLVKAFKIAISSRSKYPQFVVPFDPY